MKEKVCRIHLKLCIMFCVSSKAESLELKLGTSNFSIQKYSYYILFL